MITNKTVFNHLMINRRNLYNLFSRLFEKEIDEEFLAVLKTIEFPTEREENSLTEFRDALLRLNEYFEYDAGESLDDLAADYAKTFLAAGQADARAALPYESIYTSPKHIMMQDSWNQVCDIYESKGIELCEQTDGLLEDHIAVELSFMAFLCNETSHYTETLTGLEEQKEFLNKHLLNWVPEFCLDIKYHADTEFYRMVGQLTTGFLQLDGFILDRMITERKSRIPYSKSFRISKAYANEVLSKLKNDYHVFAPAQTPESSVHERNELIRYHEISSLEEIVNDRQSDFSPKEIIYPISQTIFTFDENSCNETISNDPKGIIVFARPCDINGLKRLDNMFLANGGTSDKYYKVMRDKVKIFLMQCEKSWDTCSCVSMGSNRTDNYSIAWKLDDEDILLKIKDITFIDYFDWASESDYEPEFITENKLIINIPEINAENLKDVFALDYWKKFNEQCISCGGCNTVCPTCSCFDTIDFLNQENSLKGERRRVWSSCMLPDYSKTAGGNIARKFPDSMMRFKTMHKIYDYNARFGGNEHMCVGCGRCIIRCPKDISFAETINGLNEELKTKQ